MMTVQAKLQHIQDHHFSEWLKVRQQVENELSDKQGMFCMCGRLATGLHENGCKRFRNKVISETLKRLEHLMPKCEWVPCDNPAKWTESDGRGGLVQVCTPHRRLLTRQKRADNNV